MDIIENWKLLTCRMERGDPNLTVSLMAIHMGAFDDLRKSGHMLSINEKSVSVLAATMEAQQRLILAGDIGRGLIKAQGDLFNGKFAIDHADDFPNCIFIALAAILENLDGTIFTPTRKMNVVCEYDTVSGNNDPLGKALPLIEKCYPWVNLSTEVHQSEPPAAAAPRFIPLDKTGLVFSTEKVAKIDTMRTVFTGTIKRGEIKKHDVLNVIDGSGKVLCHEGVVLVMYANGREINSARANQHIDEILLAVEIPAGNYSGIYLVDGDKTLAASNQIKQNTEKTSFWKKLFK